MCIADVSSAAELAPARNPPSPEVHQGQHDTPQMGPLENPLTPDIRQGLQHTLQRGPPRNPPPREMRQKAEAVENPPSPEMRELLRVLSLELQSAPDHLPGTLAAPSDTDEAPSDRRPAGAPDAAPLPLSRRLGCITDPTHS
jgi:hypothetical protein